MNEPSFIEDSALYDAMKGIGILLVIAGHSNMPPHLMMIIYAMHLPLFFFLSGITLNRTADYFEFVFKKTFSLLVPYFAFGTLLMLPTYILTYGFNPTAVYGFIFLGKGFDSALWFLPHLFLLLIISKFIITFTTSKLQTLLLFVLLEVLFYFTQFMHAWHFNILWISLPFAFIGIYSRTIILSSVLLRNWILMVIIFISLLLFYKFSLLNYSYFSKHVDLNSNFIGYVHYFVLAALIGIATVFWISTLFVRYSIIKTILTYLGKNSLYLLCLHQPIAMLLQKFWSFFTLDHNWIKKIVLIILLFLLLESLNYLKKIKESSL